MTGLFSLKKTFSQSLSLALALDDPGPQNNLFALSGSSTPVDGLIEYLRELVDVKYFNTLQNPNVPEQTQDAHSHLTMDVAMVHDSIASTQNTVSTSQSSPHMIVNGTFSVSDTANANAQFGWTVTGFGSVTNGAAVLTEDDRVPWASRKRSSSRPEPQPFRSTSTALRSEPLAMDRPMLLKSPCLMRVP